MGRQIRVSINVWYRKDKESDPEKTKFLLQEGHNTTILGKNRQHVLAHADQFRSRIEPEDVEIEEELGNEEQEDTYDFDSLTAQGMKESNNEPLEETDGEN